MISKLSRNRLQELASRTELYVDAKTGILLENDRDMTYVLG